MKMLFVRTSPHKSFWHSDGMTNLRIPLSGQIVSWLFGIALEALMAPVRSHAELVRKTAAHLAGADYRLGLTADQIRAALGLDKMLEYRNQIMHRGEWPVPWPIVPDDPLQRDWPQILCDVVGEILRRRLGAPLTGTLGKHITEGIRILKAVDQPSSAHIEVRH